LAVANRAVDSGESYEQGDPTPVACELYRQAIYWALLAHRRLSSGAADSPGPGSNDAFAELWERAAPGPLLEAAGSAAALEQHRERLLRRSFLDFHAPRTTGPVELSELRSFAEALVRRVDATTLELERLWLTRLVRVGAPTLLGLVLLAGGGVLVQRQRIARETNIPWRTSSTHPSERACESPSQSCENEDFFFCTTRERNPWIEFDLGEVRSISQVSVVNRTDCGPCPERATPLLVEVSRDAKEWSEVARQENAFTEWTARFEPTDAQYVRLRVPRRTFLHLKQVRIPH